MASDVSIRGHQFTRAQRRQIVTKGCWGHTSIPATTSVGVSGCVFWVTTIWTEGKKRRRHKKDVYILSQRTGADRLHLQLPDRIIREANECDISVNGKSCVVLIDTGSMVSTMSQSFWVDNLQDVPLHPLDDLLTLSSASGDTIPYLGYVEMSLEIQSADNGTYPLLVFRDTPYNTRVPLLVPMFWESMRWGFCKSLTYPVLLSVVYEFYISLRNIWRNHTVYSHRWHWCPV